MSSLEEPLGLGDLSKLSINRLRRFVSLGARRPPADDDDHSTGKFVSGADDIAAVVNGLVTASRSCKLKPSMRISSWNRSKSWSDEITVLIDSDMLKSLPKLSRQELEVACEDFSNIIGSTPETVVYKGTMKDGPEVSVISLCTFEGHWTSHHELFYQNKVIDLARLNHENIAKFLGYCRESDPFSRMLVFEWRGRPIFLAQVNEDSHWNCPGEQMVAEKERELEEGEAQKSPSKLNRPHLKKTKVCCARPKRN
ncbi:putative LRR receptor-like serine/threonine-protein kinase [Zea mays]|uniref:Putative LRR receptor-like serine/threonine-protein kinase n=1 Tax=Zea mays TaxID=4577 RepID=A0A1D6MTN3_MAIZE|nr:putative LRR receptor-like serine/threonine-protein kinase [Zea mays]